MESNLLEINNLNVTYKMKGYEVKAVKNFNLALNKGQTIGIIGESGSGKSTLALSIMGLLDENAFVEGSIKYKGLELNSLNNAELNKIRWDKIAVVFQNSLDVLNPVLTIDYQISEVLIKNKNMTKLEASKKVELLLEKVGLEKDIKDMYPHQLSGGMRQKVLIAMGISCNPEILIVDEPTSSLDVISKMEIVYLLNEIREKENITLIVISHQMDTILALTEEIIVMYQGLILEKGNTKEVIDEPLHMYTRGLINSSPDINPYSDMWGIPGEYSSDNNGCPFENRCTQSIEKCLDIVPDLVEIKDNRYISCNRGGIKTILNVKDVSKDYKNKNRNIKACDKINLEIKTGEVVSLIGKSGSGKTTLGSIIAGILKQDSGEVYFYDEKVKNNNFTSRKEGIQIVFQDPYSSINENLSIDEIILEPLKIIKEKNNLREKLDEVLDLVKLPRNEAFLERKAYTLSGGQRQRLSIARSLIMEPRLLIADEISSMLDLSTQANILRLLKEIQNKKGFSMLYITHDLSLARKISDRIYVINDGQIIETGSSRELFDNPKQVYTKKLIGSNLIYKGI